MMRASGLDDVMVRRFRDLERRIAALESTAVGPNGIVVGPGKSIKSSDFDGNLDALTAGSHGWALGGAQNGGVLNKLALANGIVGNDALTSPASFAAS